MRSNGHRRAKNEATHGGLPAWNPRIRRTRAGDISQLRTAPGASIFLFREISELRLWNVGLRLTGRALVQ